MTVLIIFICTFSSIGLFWNIRPETGSPNPQQYYENEIIPSFASEHKFTFVYKNTFDLKNDKGRFNTSLAMTATSGFPYYDPYNNIQYESKPYLSFDIGGSYLPNIKDGFMVIFFNISTPKSG